MPRPKSKSELQTASNQSYVALIATLDTLTDAQKRASFPFVHRDKNVRDVLAHLHEWHLLMLSWYEVGMEGSKPDMPKKGYTWKTTSELNGEIWNKYQNTSLHQIRKKMNGSHDALCKIIDAHTDAELFTKRLYSWTGTTSLGSYLTSATSSHYDWAIKLLCRFARSFQENGG